MLQSPGLELINNVRNCRERILAGTHRPGFNSILKGHSAQLRAKIVVNAGYNADTAKECSKPEMDVIPELDAEQATYYQ